MNGPHPVDSSASRFGWWLAWITLASNRIYPFYVLIGFGGLVVTIMTTTYQSQFWRTLPASVVLAAALIATVVLVVMIIQRIASGRGGEDPFDGLLADYEKGDLSLLIMIQAALRFLLVVCSVAALRGPAFDDEVDALSSDIARAMLIVVALYFLTSVFYYYKGRRENRHALAQSSATVVRGALWPPAVVDCIVITMLSIVTPFGALYHLAYIIPFLGAWLFARAGRGRVLYALIAGGVSAKLAIALVVFPWTPEPRWFESAGLGGSPLLTAIDALVKALFWADVALLCALLARLRKSETSLRIKAEERRQVLDTVCDNLPFPIFAKNRDRRFIYVNKRFLEALGRQASDVIGHTDEELGIGCDEYRESDWYVLNAITSPPPVFQGLEPTFERAAKRGTMILTTKQAMVDAQGKIVGVVGICEPGEPAESASMRERVLECAPYYLLSKDRSLHIRDGNRRFLAEDVGMSRAELQGMNGGLGATDIDVYGSRLGRKYREADAKVIADAEDALDHKQDPEKAEYHGVELHRFLRTGQQRWVSVTKQPWLSTAKTDVRGIHVSFHDIHESFCLKGLTDRWFNVHMPAALSALAREESERPNGRRPGYASLGLRLLALQAATVRWIRQLIVDEPVEVTYRRFKLADLAWLGPALERQYPNIAFSFGWTKSQDVLSGDSHVLEAFILLLSMNACEAIDSTASMQCGRLIEPSGAIVVPGRPTVKIHVSVADGRIQIEVADDGCGFSSEAGEDIRSCSKLNKHNLPGTGIFFARNIATLVGGEFDIKSPGVGRGATATFACSAQSFEQACSGGLLNNRPRRCA